MFIKANGNMIVFGVGTPAAAIPTRGEAIYQTGYFGADAYRHGSGDGVFSPKILRSGSDCCQFRHEFS